MLDESIHVMKTVIDSGTVVTAVAAFITTWVPSVLLFLALGWWVMRYWEIITGRNIADLVILKKLFKVKKSKK